MKDEIKKGAEGLRVRTSRPFALKDKVGRNFVVIRPTIDFGFYPEMMVIEKVPGQNNRMVVRAVLTPEEIEKEDKKLAEQEKDKKDSV